MRRTLLAFTGLALALAASAPAGPRAPAPVQPAAVTQATFLVSGRGWGHGVGMSQYGALGFANDAWSYDRILAHYYTGAQLGPAGVAQVRVLVAEAAAAVTVGSKGPFRARDALGTMHFLEAGSVRLGPRLRVTANGVPRDLAGPVRLLPGSAPLEVNGVAYRGQVEVSVTGGKLDAVNHLGLEQYLFGVVPKEMPSEWPLEALKAQAVAARSYALAHLVRGKPFDLYADVRSQVYGGIPAERARSSTAIRQTAGEVLLWQGRPIDALFHSTSGGATIDAAELFGTAVPYLLGVEDPHSALSPVHRWGPVPVPEPTIRKALKLRSRLTALKPVRARSGRVATVQVVTAAGTTTVSGATLRLAAGLRSTWVTRIASLSLTRPGGPVVHGRAVTVTGKAAGVEGAVLSERVGGAWKPVGKPGVAFSVKRKLQAPAAFRLSVGKVAGPVLKVPVAPLVTAKAAAGAVSGTVVPAIPGRPVELQLEGGGRWQTVATGTTDAAGGYVVALAGPGLYRARVAPAGGLAQGLSAPIELR